MRIRVSLLLASIAIFFSSIASATYTGLLCQDNRFTCHTVKSRESWQSLFPDEEFRDVVKRLNRMNTRLHSGMKIAIPNNDDTNIMDYAPFPKQITAPGKKIIFVSLNPKTQAFGAYDEDGNLVRWGPTSGGQSYCPDIHRGCHSPTGTFSIYSKEGAYCVSTKFPVGEGGAPMPYCMFFHGGFALHGSYEVPGHNASHGCVRLFIPDAEWLNHEFVDGPVTVVISYQE